MVLAARDVVRLEAVRTELGSERTLVVETDVARRADVARLVDRTMAALGRVEILVNNAGIGLSGCVADFDLDHLDEVFRINVFGAVSCIQAVVPHMRAQGFGHIVNVSSILGKRSVPQTAGYAASKFALHALSDGLRLEEERHGIDVTVVCPGSTDTDFRENELRSGSVLLAERPRVSAMGPERVARVIVQAIRRRKREVLLTPFAHLLVGLERLSPRLVDRALARVYRPKEET